MSSAPRTASSDRPSRLAPLLPGLRRRSGALAGLAVLLLAALYAAGPYWTLRALRAALREGDAAELARRIDLPQARAAVQAQLEPMLARAAQQAARPASAAAVLGWVGPQIAQPLAAPLLDWVFTPAGIAEFARRDGEPLRELLVMAVAPTPVTASPQAPAGPPAALHPQDWLESVALRRFCGPARFCVSVAGGWSFELAPYGLRWKVRSIALPPDLLERGSR